MEYNFQSSGFVGFLEKQGARPLLYSKTEAPHRYSWKHRAAHRKFRHFLVILRELEGDLNSKRRRKL